MKPLEKQLTVNIIWFYSESPYLFEFAGFDFAGSTITQKTVTKGKTKQQGRTGSVLGGAAIGSIIAPGVGTIVGGMAGGSRKKKGTIDSTSVTTTEENQEKPLLSFVLSTVMKSKQLKLNSHKLKLTTYKCSF